MLRCCYPVKICRHAGIVGIFLSLIIFSFFVNELLTESKFPIRITIHFLRVQTAARHLLKTILGRTGEAQRNVCTFEIFVAHYLCIARTDASAFWGEGGYLYLTTQTQSMCEKNAIHIHV